MLNNISPDTRVIDLTTEQLVILVTTLISKSLPAPTIKEGSQFEFACDLLARQILGGSEERPLSKDTFNKLRKEEKIKTYRSSEGRTLYSVKELNDFIRSDKSEQKNRS